MINLTVFKICENKIALRHIDTIKMKKPQHAGQLRSNALTVLCAILC